MDAEYVIHMGTENVLRLKYEMTWLWNDWFSIATQYGFEKQECLMCSTAEFFATFCNFLINLGESYLNYFNN